MSLAGEGSETAQRGRIDSDHLAKGYRSAGNHFHRGIEQHQLGHAVNIAFLKHQTVGGVAAPRVDADDASVLIEEVVLKGHKEPGDRHARLHKALAGDRVDPEVKASGLVETDGCQRFLIGGKQHRVLAAERLSRVREPEQFIDAVVRVETYQSAFIGTHANPELVAIVIPHPIGIRGDFHV